MKFSVMSVICCIILGLVKSDDSPCPALDCPKLSTVGCFIAEEECQCFCVEREDACEYIVRHYVNTCRSNQIMHCTSDSSECNCRCEQK